MSVAYFVVLNVDDPGFDPFVDGKVFTKHLDRINQIAATMGLPAFEDYASQDLSEFGGPEAGDAWFDPADGISWVEAVTAHLRSDPTAVADSDEVLEDLDDYLRVFREADKRGLQWHLELDF